MKVILKQDVEKLDRRGDVVNVAPGFGRNYLIPRKMALAVTATNVKTIEIERQALKKKAEAERQSFQGVIQKLNQVTLSFTRRAGEKDVIFGSVSSGDGSMAKMISKSSVTCWRIDEPLRSATA